MDPTFLRFFYLSQIIQSTELSQLLKSSRELLNSSQIYNIITKYNGKDCIILVIKQQFHTTPYHKYIYLDQQYHLKLALLLNHILNNRQYLRPHNSQNDYEN